MAMAKTLMAYLEQRGISYYQVEHEHTQSASESAKAANVPAHQVAKAVLLQDEAGFLVSVLPANHTLEISWVNEALDRNLKLSDEKELLNLFGDCELGAVPALCEAYGVQVVWDDQLAYTSEIFIEAGDHEHLISLEHKDFKKLMSSLPHSIISKGSEFQHWRH